MKKVKKILCLCLATCMLSIGTGVTAFAEESKEMVFGDDYLPQSLVNYSIDDKVMNTNEIEKSRTMYCESNEYDIVDIVVSKENIEIESNAFSEFIDVFGKLEDGTYVNITDDVSCKFDDESIATWIYGRTLAEAKGETTMILTYNGVSKEINVTVKNYIDFEEISKEINNLDDKNTINTRSIASGIKRQDAVDTAIKMVFMKWTPAQTFNTWFGTNKDPFYAGTEYAGIPYTKYKTQTTKSEFMYALKNEDNFYVLAPYKEYRYDLGKLVTYYVPRYGNDCSGFVSICWGLTGKNGARDKWNTTDFSNAINNGTFDTIEYSEIQGGDALLKSGHVILANYIFDPTGIAGRETLYCYEQIGTKACPTCYTFQQLQDAGFQAFTRF